MAIETVGRAEAGAPGASPIAAPALPPRRDFAAVLDAHLAEPRSQLSDLRAQLDAIRSGRLGAAAEGAAARTTDYSQLVKQWAARGAGAADPHGWRSATRAIGEQSVGPGFGALFERQIAQESGFDPAVVLGQRRSSAGAEGIAQLMPQYYPGVDRTDPVASLQAGAATMRHNLVAFDGDVRKALAAYNAGLGRVQQLVQAHGIEWERALPAETKQYLAAIVGDAKTTFRPVGEAAVYGGRGTSGVLTSPLARVLGRQYGGRSAARPARRSGCWGCRALRCWRRRTASCGRCRAAPVSARPAARCWASTAGTAGARRSTGSMRCVSAQAMSCGAVSRWGRWDRAA